MWDSRARRPGESRPRISPWVRGYGYRQWKSGALAPHGHTLVHANAKLGCFGAADSGFVAIRKCKGHFILGMNIGMSIILADGGPFKGASSERRERCRAEREQEVGGPKVRGGGKGSFRPNRYRRGQERGVGRTRPSFATCARFLWGSPIFCRKNIFPG